MNRITIEEFSGLPDQEQREILKNIGVYLDSFYSGGEKREFYSIDHFFVEVQIDLVDPIPVKIKAFDTGEEIDQYSTIFNELITELFHP
ncbi:hypothetical protein [Salinimicrobium sp. HB62]|uniref:hypothetical protein n=1 Tax=Salinimicrobium sp. HB62 TaxID=3077781 RepID=UPI002D785829|nr:hypothetical protein [Salinimicrobium sp. HB62]